MLDFIKVESSSLDLVKHDPVANQLFVVFKSGEIYRYENVSAREYDDLIAAESIGKHFHKHIRNDKAFEKFGG